MSSAMATASTGRISLRRDLFTATVTNSNLGYDWPQCHGERGTVSREAESFLVNLWQFKAYPPCSF